MWYRVRLPGLLHYVILAAIVKLAFDTMVHESSLHLVLYGRGFHGSLSEARTCQHSWAAMPSSDCQVHGAISAGYGYVAGESKCLVSEVHCSECH